MKEYLSLLLAFQALPRLRRTSTFMEIAGYSHYENVCSNILKFFFDPQGEHGMGTLLLKAFLAMAGKAEVTVPESVSIRREQPAEDRQRIDLMIDCENFTIGIENKIYHWEANNLDNYSGVIESRGHDKPVIKAILCLKTNPGQEAPKGGFVRYTYARLWSHVRDLLGHHISAAAPKWVIYLTEFMETTTRLAGETQEEKEVTDFFIHHHDAIEKLLSDCRQMERRMAARISNIASQGKEFPQTPYLKQRSIYKDNTLASHFTIQGTTIGLDLHSNLKGWFLILFQFTPKTTSVLEPLSRCPSMQSLYPEMRMEHSRYVLQRWDLHATELDLQPALIQALNALIAAADHLSNQLPNPI
ncbi:MAG: hypothetical protein JWM59_1244 [Verrucomicrobiales bacterium]|nr:hypothetical protein [Verrucomicrobiales bacterium]